MNRVQEHTRKRQRECKSSFTFLTQKRTFEGRGNLIFYVRHWLGIKKRGNSLLDKGETVWRRGRDLNPRYPMGKLDFE